MEKKKKAGVISLGCDKNRVDTEKMLSRLSEKYEITNDPEEAKILVVNTCAFLNDARKEAIEEILSCARLKENGRLEKLAVTGCLPQKFGEEVFAGIPEIDVMAGISDYDKLVFAIEESYGGVRKNIVGKPACEPDVPRVLTTDGYAYLKIADGCSNFCTYCLIPKIRGAYRSVPEDQLAREAAALGELGELVLVAQDVTKYGTDLSGGENVVRLIRRLSALENVKKIRLLYCYPESVSEELIDEIAKNDKVLKYIDIPLQHADDGVLRRMNRKGTYQSYLALVRKLKARVPGIAVRSTFIAGFPGESEESFARLCAFLEEAELFNAGFFRYSREEDTAAARMDGQIPARVKTARVKKLYAVQKKIVKKQLAAQVGRELDVFVENFDGACWAGRAYFNAPEIDGKVYFTGGREFRAGDTAKVKITGAGDYDLFGEAVDK